MPALWRIYPPEWQYDAFGISNRHSFSVPMGDVTPPADDDPGPVKPEPVEPEPEPIYYTVVPGDGWWRIAFKNGMTVDELRALNPERVGKVIHPGDRFIVGYQDNSPSNNS